MGLTFARGPSTKATGTLTANTASVLAFPTPSGLAPQTAGMSMVIVSNTSNAIAYFKLNDSVTAPTVSPTNYDFALMGTAGVMVSMTIAKSVYVTNVSVYSANTTGIGMVGW